MNAPLAPWKPRASQVGSYVMCDARAAWDRAIYEGLIPSTPEIDEAKKSSKFADLGTWAHFVLMDGLRCVFPGPPAMHEPTNEQKKNVEDGFFSGNTAAAYTHVRAIATLAARELPKPADGKPWLAESEWETDWSRGHIDFLSMDHQEVWDLKTTSKPPAHQRIKSEHLYQLATYARFAGCKRGGILYVDSREASWAVAIPIDFTSPEMVRLSEQTEDYCRYLMSDELYAKCMPRFGTHCSDGFCPFKSECRDKHIPPSTKIHESQPFTPPASLFTV